MRPLEGITVLDLTRVLSGPYCTMLLADMGARVIKVEQPGKGDDTRAWGPPFLAGESAYFLSINRNKESVTLDFKHPDGRAILDRLIAKSDVLVENFRPGTLTRQRLDYDAIAARYPRLVYCSISGFGRAGADRARPALDPVIQAMSGIMQLTGSDETGPLRTGFPFSDLVTPLFATIGVLAALRVRERTGRGQRVDLSMLDATIFGMMPREAYFFATGRTPSRLGNEHYQIAPWNTYETADGRYMIVVAHTEKFWHALLTALDAPELGADPRFLSNADRVRNRTALNARLAAAFRTASIDEWTPRLTAAGVLFAPVRSFPEVFSDPRVRREMLVELDHPTAGRITVLANPLRFSETPATVRRCPPRLGEHTAEVLSPDTDEAGGAAS